MLMAPLARGWFTAAVVVWMAMDGAQAQTQDIAPINSGANPYRVIRDWAQITSEGRPWGGSNGVAIDRDGKATDRLREDLDSLLKPRHCPPRERRRISRRAVRKV